VRELLGSLGYPLQLRMIDGMPAFPDEEPHDSWRELRVGVPEGMVSIRRAPDRVILVTWGNAEAGLRQAWNALTWAFAETSAGTIQTEQGSQDANTFRQNADLPAALRKS
jgi:hypothetical protein